MNIIGLTGGIGSGKSTVSRMLKDEGFPIVDADLISREVVEPGQPALGRLAEAFGPSVLNDDGSLNRGELARLAFADEEHTKLLNDITHPAINDRTREQFNALRNAGTEAAIYDMPLLIEEGFDRLMDLVVVVDVAASTRLERLVQQRGLDRKDAEARIVRQIDDETRRAAADVIIDNNGTLEDLKPQVSDLAQKIRALPND